MLRAGPFSDERVIRRINRRFVPLYFDLNPGGAVADAKARAFVVKALPLLGAPAVPTPPLLLLTPDGELVEQIDNYASEEAVLAAFAAVLKRRSEWNRPGADEERIAKSGTPCERADLLYDLGHEAAARTLLGKDSGADAATLLAHLCRLDRKWQEVEPALARATGPAHADDVHVERAWVRWAAHDWDAVLKELAAVAEKSPRRSEAGYLTGLAQWHAGKKEAALATWKGLIESCSQDPWIYRADWAFTQVSGQGEASEFSTAGERVSPLGRIGYMGRRNPDLDPP